MCSDNKHLYVEQLLSDVDLNISEFMDFEVYTRPIYAEVVIFPPFGTKSKYTEIGLMTIVTRRESTENYIFNYYLCAPDDFINIEDRRKYLITSTLESAIKNSDCSMIKLLPSYKNATHKVSSSISSYGVIYIFRDTLEQQYNYFKDEIFKLKDKHLERDTNDNNR